MLFEYLLLLDTNKRLLLDADLRNHDLAPDGGRDARDTLQRKKVKVADKVGFGCKGKVGGRGVDKVHVVDLDYGAFGGGGGGYTKVFRVCWGPSTGAVRERGVRCYGCVPEDMTAVREGRACFMR